MAKTLNHDVAGFVNRVRRFKIELHKSASSNVSFFSEADANRFRSYLSALIKYKSWVQTEPILDLPESAPREIDLGEPEVLQSTENEAVNDLLEMLHLLEVELMNSQSSRLPSKLISHDEVRLNALIEKMSRYLEDYIMQVQPLDLPESAPSKALSGAGKTGIHI